MTLWLHHRVRSNQNVLTLFKPRSILLTEHSRIDVVRVSINFLSLLPGRIHGTRDQQQNQA